MNLTVFVAGTWGLGDPEALDKLVQHGEADELPWWHQNSVFGKAARAAGALPLFEWDHPFIWATTLDVGGTHAEWYAGGWALESWHRLWSWNNITEELDRDTVNLIAHSHGGQVAVYAAILGLKVGTLVTLGTPVRRDMLRWRRKARPNINRWVHIYSPNDQVQLEGEIGDGKDSWLEWPREMPEADENISEPTVNDAESNAHTKLHDPALWTERKWWEYVK